MGQESSKIEGGASAEAARLRAELERERAQHVQELAEVRRLHAEALKALREELRGEARERLVRARKQARQDARAKRGEAVAESRRRRRLETREALRAAAAASMGRIDGSSVVVLLARQRSGTTALRSVLDTHPDIHCFPEVFNTLPGEQWAEFNYFKFVGNHTDGDVASVLASEDHEELFLDFLEYLRHLTAKRFMLIDVKYMSANHVTKGWRFLSEEPHLFHLIKKHGMRVLNLRRRNYLRYFLSQMKAQSEEVWMSRSRSRTEWADRSVILEVDELLRTLELCRAEDALVDQAFAGYGPFLKLEYEDLFGETDAPIADSVLERIAGLLGVDVTFEERKPTTRKQSVLPLGETIENYEKVAEALRGTDFEYCLKDEGLYRRPPLRA